MDALVAANARAAESLNCRVKLDQSPRAWKLTSSRWMAIR